MTRGRCGFELDLQLFSIRLEAARSVRGSYTPRGHSGDVSDLAPSIILVLCDNLARNKNGLRKSTVGPQVTTVRIGSFSISAHSLPNLSANRHSTKLGKSSQTHLIIWARIYIITTYPVSS
jgi:hypothetical protein